MAAMKAAMMVLTTAVTMVASMVDWKVAPWVQMVFELVYSTVGLMDYWMAE